jgi:hypothetical protein
MMWRLSSSSDPVALAIVDGTGRWSGSGPHYSRRTPGSKTFTGVGQEIVLVTDDGTAVWAVVRQRTPSKAGSGSSRGRVGCIDPKPRFVWRNMVFRNLGERLSSELVLRALEMTYCEWPKRYGKLPLEVLRTEVDPSKVRSKNPGCCYKKAGFHNPRIVRGKIYLDAPCPSRLLLGECSCCHGSSLRRPLSPPVCEMCNGVGFYVSLPGDVISPCPYCSEKDSTRLTAEAVNSGSNDSAPVDNDGEQG